MRIFFIVICIALKNYACALCAAYTPSADIVLDFHTHNDTITQIDVSWEFSEEFFNVLLENYDFNYNDKFDPGELEIIEYTLLDYIGPKNFLTQMQLYPLEEKVRIKEFKNPKLYIDSPRLFFHYEMILDIPIEHNNTFSMKIYDDGGFFHFNFKNQNSIALNSQYYITPNPNLNVIFFQIYEGKLEQGFFVQEDLNRVNKNVLDQFNDFNNKLFAYIKDILRKDFDLRSFLVLLTISFAYGIFHASAPGHAKIITSSYFLTHQSTWLKISYFVFRIGVIHILSAFLLVSIGVILLENLLKDVNKEAGFILTKFTSLIIIFIVLFMIGKKILSAKKQCSCSYHKVNEWGIILAAALVPCPGVVLLIVFAYEFNFWYALSSALFISLGMCLVLFAFAVGANRIYKSVLNVKLRTFLEYFALIVMLLFALFLFINIRTSVF